jgi:hypothetical protein
MSPEEAGMLIDCDTCSVRGAACRDCVVTVILSNPTVSGPRELIDLDDDERAAMGSLAAAGLLPPLRLVPVREASLDERGIA